MMLHNVLYRPSNECTLERMWWGEFFQAVELDAPHPCGAERDLILSGRYWHPVDELGMLREASTALGTHLCLP